MVRSWLMAYMLVHQRQLVFVGSLNESIYSLLIKLLTINLKRRNICEWIKCTIDTSLWNSKLMVFILMWDINQKKIFCYWVLHRVKHASGFCLLIIFWVKWWKVEYQSFPIYKRNNFHRDKLLEALLLQLW